MSSVHRIRLASALILLSLPSARALAQPGEPTKAPGEFARVADLPAKLAEKLADTTARLDAATSAATTCLRAFLQAEMERRYGDSFALLYDGFGELILRDEWNRAIVNDIRLFQKPPQSPKTNEKEAIARVAALVEGKKLDLEKDAPALWAYQWSHSTGSIDADFPVTGPYSNEYRLVGCRVIHVGMDPLEHAVAWVWEELELPAGLKVSQLGQYRLQPEGDKGWRIFSYRALDGPLLETWLGRRTCYWPDQLAEQAGLKEEDIPANAR